MYGNGDGGDGGSDGDVMRRGGRSSSGLEGADNCALSFPLILLPSDRRMADQIVICTIKSHGAKVARTHMYDWLILLLLVVIEAILLIIEPFHRFLGVDMMDNIKYPLKGNTVPFWAVPLLAIMLPFVVILIFYFRRHDVYDFHHAILGLLFSVLLTAVITDSIKDAVGRPRPDFFYRCFPDGNATFNPVTKDVMCNGDKAVIKEGYKSFPSGHTSWSFAGLGFLAWYLSGKIKAFDRRGHVAKLGIVLLPYLVAALVGVSRVDDYWHHWQDVFTGALIGTVVSTFCYLQFFPMPYDTNGWAPHAYFRMIEESNRSGGSAQRGNSLEVRRTEVETSYMGANDGLGGGEYGARDRTTVDIEAGRRR